MSVGTVSNAMRRRWDEHIAYLLEYGELHMNDWEGKFVDDISIRRSGGYDLTMRQALVLSRIYKKVEEAVG